MAESRGEAKRHLPSLFSEPPGQEAKLPEPVEQVGTDDPYHDSLGEDIVYNLHDIEDDDTAAAVDSNTNLPADE